MGGGRMTWRRRSAIMAVVVIMAVGVNMGCWEWPWKPKPPVPSPSPSPTVEPTPVPTPTPEPTAPPTPEPTPSPTMPPTPQPPEPGEPPDASDCPLVPPAGSVYLKNKPYGHGFDATVRVADKAFCEAIYGAGVVDCHLEGLGQPRNHLCSRWLIGGCPTWQYTLDQKAFYLCHDDRVGAAISCDHFGSPASGQDDPDTPGFEGYPAGCGLQRDEFGPMAGFFVVPHGAGYVRACMPGTAYCGKWLPVDY